MPKSRSKANAEQAFDNACRAEGIPLGAPEYRFHPSQNWRFDRAWPTKKINGDVKAIKVAVEIEGGVWTQGRHTRGQGYTDDCEKYSTAAVMGWCVIRIPAYLVTRDPWKWLDLVRRALKERGVLDNGN